MSKRIGDDQKVNFGKKKGIAMAKEKEPLTGMSMATLMAA